MASLVGSILAILLCGGIGGVVAWLVVDALGWTGTGAHSLKTTSGSMRGCTRRASDCEARPEGAYCTVCAQACAHIGW